MKSTPQRHGIVSVKKVRDLGGQVDYILKDEEELNLKDISRTFCPTSIFSSLYFKMGERKEAANLQFEPEPVRGKAKVAA